MSGKYTGVTFANQKVSPSDDAIVRRAILPDGKLTGCEITYSGSTLTMAAGQIMVCGRQIRNPAAQNWAVVDATSGFARLVLTIDLTRTATKETFDQVTDSIEYATSENGFVSLDQSDINRSGTRYQVAVCTVSLGAGGITGIVSQLEQCEVGAGLNFKVVGGLTQPTGPKENTIWVKTEKIGAWYFSATQPEGMQDWDVWFSIDTSSLVEFNALKKNGIQVYPISAKQHVSGALVDVEAKNYQNGSWVEWWDGTLIAPNNTYVPFTGGWVAEAKFNVYGDGAMRAPLISNTSDFVVFKSNGASTGGCFHTVNKVDVSKFKTLSIDVQSASSSNAAIIFFLASSLSGAAGGNSVASVFILKEGTKNASGVFSIDVTNITGSYYIGISYQTWVSYNDLVMNFRKVRLIR